MSKKKRLLGPDGKPLPPSKKPVTVAYGGVDISHQVKDFTFDFTIDTSRWYTGLFGVDQAPGRRLSKPKGVPLADAVEAQVAALTATFDGVGGEELPKAAADLTRYDDAFASAAKNCDHPDAEDVAYAKREMYCPTCRRYFKRPRGMFGW